MAMAINRHAPCSPLRPIIWLHMARNAAEIRTDTSTVINLRRSLGREAAARTSNIPRIMKHNALLGDILPSKPTPVPIFPLT